MQTEGERGRENVKSGDDRLGPTDLPLLGPRFNLKDGFRQPNLQLRPCLVL